DSSLRQVFIYRPNASLYRAAGRWHYTDSQLDGKERSYRLVAVEAAEILDATVARARDGASLGDLAGALVDEEVTLAEAEEYVAGLIESQILVPDIALAITGPEPIHTLIEQFSRYPATAPMAGALEQVRTKLAALDATGLGNPPEQYRIVAG